MISAILLASLLLQTPALRPPEATPSASSDLSARRRGRARYYVRKAPKRAEDGSTLVRTTREPAPAIAEVSLVPAPWKLWDERIGIK